MFIYRKASSLIEVMIAMTIFVSILGILIEISTTFSSYAVLSMTRDDLANESKTIFKEIQEDVSHTAWEFFDLTADNMQSMNDRSMLPDSRSGNSMLTYRYYPYVIQQNFVGTEPNSSSGAGLSSKMTYFARDPKISFPFQQTLPPLPDSIGSPEDFKTIFTKMEKSIDERRRLYNNSFFARSQELVFLRVNLDGWSELPRDNTPIINFPRGEVGDWINTEEVRLPDEKVVIAKNKHEKLGIIRMDEFLMPPNNDNRSSGEMDVRSPMSFYWNRPTAPTNLQKIHPVVNQGTILTTNTGSQAAMEMIQIRWDSMANPSSSYVNSDGTHLVLETPTDKPARIKWDMIREYGYVVVPAFNSIGALARVYSRPRTDAVVANSYPGPGSVISTDGTREIVIEKILSYNVSRIVFDTFRTDEDHVLQPNQIRVRLYMIGLVKKANTATPFVKFDMTFTMKTMNSLSDNDRVTSTLGTVTPNIESLETPFVY